MADLSRGGRAGVRTHQRGEPRADAINGATGPDTATSGLTGRRRPVGRRAVWNWARDGLDGLLLFFIRLIEAIALEKTASIK